MEISEIEILPFQPSQFPPTETSGHVESMVTVRKFFTCRLRSVSRRIISWAFDPAVPTSIIIHAIAVSGGLNEYFDHRDAVERL